MKGTHAVSGLLRQNGLWTKSGAQWSLSSQSRSLIWLFSPGHSISFNWCNTISMLTTTSLDEPFSPLLRLRIHWRPFSGYWRVSAIQSLNSSQCHWTLLFRYTIPVPVHFGKPLLRNCITCYIWLSFSNNVLGCFSNQNTEMVIAITNRFNNNAPSRVQTFFRF